VGYKTSDLTPQSLDGDLTKPAWAEVAWTEEFVDIATTTKPKYLTRAKIRWDDHYLYVGAYLEEAAIWANLTQDDEVIFHDNDFEIFVDPAGTTHYYKEFEMNALNKRWDLCLNRAYGDGGYENSTRVFGNAGWGMPGLRSAAAVHPPQALNNPAEAGQAWTVEVALPLLDLMFNSTDTRPEAGTMWRIDFSRVEWGVKVVNGRYEKAASCQSCASPGTEAEDNWVWSPQGEVAMHLPERWGILQFADGAVNATEAADYDRWPSQATAVALYYAQKAYAGANGGAYTQDFRQLLQFSQKPFEVCPQAVPTISVTSGSDGKQEFTATVRSPASPQWAATITSDRYLTVAAASGAPTAAEKGGARGSSFGSMCLAALLGSLLPATARSLGP